MSRKLASKMNVHYPPNSTSFLNWPQHAAGIERERCEAELSRSFGHLTLGSHLPAINFICLFLTGVQGGSASVFERADREITYHTNMP